MALTIALANIWWRRIRLSCESSLAGTWYVRLTGSTSLSTNPVERKREVKRGNEGKREEKRGKERKREENVGKCR